VVSPFQGDEYQPQNPGLRPGLSDLGSFGAGTSNVRKQHPPGMKRQARCRFRTAKSPNSTLLIQQQRRSSSRIVCHLMDDKRGLLEYAGNQQSSTKVFAPARACHPNAPVVAWLS
jgi:hypothetical protein